MWRALILLNLYGCQAVTSCMTLAQLTANTAFLVFFAVNSAYVRQPDNHIIWTKRMPFASSDPTHLRTNVWNFCDSVSSFGGGWKFLSWPFWIFFWIFLNFFEIFLFCLPYSYLNKSQINVYQGWDQILMITLISSRNLGVYKIITNKRKLVKNS